MQSIPLKFILTLLALVLALGIYKAVDKPSQASATAIIEYSTAEDNEKTFRALVPVPDESALR